MNFDGITYAKGASVLKQLVAYVGRENFLAGVRAYFAKHAWQNASLADLLDALEQASGRDLAGWSKAWLETAGVNTLRPAFEIDADGRFASFAVVQTAPPSHPVLRPHRIAVGLYDRGPGGLGRRGRVELDVTGERTEVPELAGQQVPDLVLVNDDDLTFAKIRLDDRSLSTLIGSIGTFSESLPAALCWAAAWDMTRDAELAARDYVALALSGVGSITSIAMLQTVLAQAVAAVRRYADPDWRAQGLAAWPALCACTCREPSPDRTSSSRSRRPSRRSRPRLTTSHCCGDLLDGSHAINGLEVDTDLRWALLHRLVSRGEAGTDAIDAEHDRDRTDAGDRHALACQAAIPEAAAKAQAWEQIVSGELPNASFRAALGGFYSADQENLVAPYAPKYFEVVPGLWRTWGSDMAQFFAEYGYPSTVVTQEAVDAAAAYLERADLPRRCGG